jgi:tRNA-Thr(GGU) m(6)t(6)A37 methyltransferase TsaA
VQPSFEPIGVGRSPLRSRKDAPRSARDGAPAAVLELGERFAAALEGVRAGMDLVLVTWLHEGLRDVLQVRPGRDRTRDLTGVFATRSPDRPNPIGLHRITVTAVEPPARVHVAALEAIDGTPILRPQDRPESDRRLGWSAMPADEPHVPLGEQLEEIGAQLDWVRGYL